MICSKIVLIVEDDKDIREALAEALEDHSYRPVGVSNGQEALEALRRQSQRPCVILLDIMMPVMDGWQFRELLDEDPALRSIPVVVLTAHVSPREVAQQIKAAAYLRKPIRLDTLLDIVEQTCQGQASSLERPQPALG